MIIDDGVPEDNDNNAVETPEMFDLYINIQVGIPRVNDGDLYHATVKRHVIHDDGKPLGVETSNPITDIRLYEL